MRIACLTLCDEGYYELADYTNKGKNEYCRKHGYYILFGKKPHSLTFWDQYLYVRDYLSQFDWIWKSDTDLAIMNPNIKLEEILKDRKEDFLIGTDYNGINCGNCFFKNTNWTFSFIAKWLGGRPRMGHWTNPDQTVLAHMLPCVERDRWAVLPQRTCNSYLYQLYGSIDECPEGQFQKGDFCLHLPAISNQRRLEIFSMVAKEIGS